MTGFFIIRHSIQAIRERIARDGTQLAHRQLFQRRLRDRLKTIVGGEASGAVTHCWNVAEYALFTARCQGLISTLRNYLL
jgi:hypothetical protein